jgi:hypothetical protein
MSDQPKLPSLPEPVAWKVAASYFAHHDCIPPGLLPPVAEPEPLYTADQLRAAYLAGMEQAAKIARNSFNVHLLWNEACKEWGNAVGGPDEYEIFADKIVSCIAAAIRRAAEELSPSDAGKMGERM